MSGNPWTGEPLLADILIDGGILVTMNEKREVFRGALAIREGRIAGLGPSEKVRGGFSAKRVIEGRGRLVLPGLINVHDHLRNMTGGLKVAEGLKIDEFLRVWWAMQEKMGEEDYYVGALSSCVRQLKAGVTTVVDHCYPHHRPGLDEASLRAYRESGIRWRYARGIMTKPYPPICERAKVAFERMEGLLRSGEVRPEELLVAPVSFRQAEPEVYRESRAFADAHGLRLYTHFAETPIEVQGYREEFKKGPIELLEHLGFLGPDVILIHCIYLSEEEIRRLRDTGTHVVHCPSNHMKMAKGVAPVPRMLSEGVNVCLGIDLMDDMFTEIQNALHLQSIHHLNPSALTKAQALEMATRNGARALGLDAGTLEVGKRADLILINVEAARSIPLLDVFHTLLYQVRPDDVEMVIVDGEVKVEDFRVLTVDEEELRERVRRVARDYVSRIAPPLEPYVSETLWPKGIGKT